ncbi:MAG TPA: Rieske 2Fe-2S domain-containing protein [Gaiellaceae bacterium]|nr:Rieske 2Fe-2S domain-containing protein [Gaiellaceae bacterium]
MASHGGDERPHLPSPTIWPVGFAVGIAVLLVGVILGWLIAAIGAAIAAVFGFLWIRDVTVGVREAPPPEPEPEPVTSAPPIPAHKGGPAMPEPGEGEIVRFPRSKFLEGTTLGLGALIGGIITVPVAGFAVVPTLVDQGHDEIDVGAVDDFPENQFVITTFLLDPEQGEVSRRTAYIRNNGFLNDVPSFTVLSNRCVHLGCPVQVNGLPIDDQKKVERKNGAELTRIPTAAAAGFGCPCHGGQYDDEGNRTAGPPVRALDRYEFKIKDGRLLLGKTFSVGGVEGKGAEAKIKKYTEMGPGQHVDGPEALFYPVPSPR